jgi:hypothetical protein
MQNVLTVDNLKEKQESMYDIIEAEIRGVYQALYSNRIVSTAPPPLEELELGYESAQLRRLVDAIEAHLHRA